MKEIWKAIKDYPKYEISNRGRVRSYVLNNNGTILRPIPQSKGYRHIFLSENNTSKNILIHTLVLTAFVSERPVNYQCNHKNGIKADNRLENLEWVTGRENIIHSFKNGLRKPYFGDRHHSAKLKESNINEIRQLAIHNSNRRIAKMFNVSPSTINQVVRGLIWKRVLPSTDIQKTVIPLFEG